MEIVDYRKLIQTPTEMSGGFEIILDGNFHKDGPNISKNKYGNIGMTIDLDTGYCVLFYPSEVEAIGKAIEKYKEEK